MKKMGRFRQAKVISICCMAVSAVFMALPYGVAMRFISNPDPPMESVTLYYSYFSGMPFGYANWFPMIAAWLSVAILARLIFGAILAAKRKDFGADSVGAPTLICIIECIIASLLSWLLFKTLSIISVIILLLHITAFVLLYNLYRKNNIMKKLKEDTKL